MEIKVNTPKDGEWFLYIDDLTTYEVTGSVSGFTGRAKVHLFIFRDGEGEAREKWISDLSPTGEFKIEIDPISVAADDKSIFRFEIIKESKVLATSSIPVYCCSAVEGLFQKLKAEDQWVKAKGAPPIDGAEVFIPKRNLLKNPKIIIGSQMTHQISMPIKKYITLSEPVKFFMRDIERTSDIIYSMRIGPTIPRDDLNLPIKKDSWEESTGIKWDDEKFKKLKLTVIGFDGVVSWNEMKIKKATKDRVEFTIPDGVHANMFVPALVLEP